MTNIVFASVFRSTMKTFMLLAAIALLMIAAADARRGRGRGRNRQSSASGESASSESGLRASSSSSSERGPRLAVGTCQITNSTGDVTNSRRCRGGATCDSDVDIVLNDADGNVAFTLSFCTGVEVNATAFAVSSALFQLFDCFFLLYHCDINVNTCILTKNGQ